MCSLFGIIDYSNALSRYKLNTLLKELSKECEVRGTDASGIAYNNFDRLSIYKRPLSASRMNFRLPENVHTVTGHTRLTTKGSEDKNINNHPFFGKAGNTRFALAHNGVIYNDETLRLENKLPQTQIETDSYIAVQLLEKCNDISFNSLSKMAEQLSGSFCFSILTETNDVYLIKGNNPLHIYDCGGFYVYASTKDILDNTLQKCRIKSINTIDISQEEILHIKNDGSIDKTEFRIKPAFHSYSSYLWDDIYGYSQDDDMDYLIEYAGYFGITEDIIIFLLDIGYTTTDIEDLLYDPEEISRVLDCYYEEMMFCES